MMLETNPYAAPLAPLADLADSHGLKRSVLLMIVCRSSRSAPTTRSGLPAPHEIESSRFSVKLALWPLLLFSTLFVIQFVVGLIAGETPVNEAFGIGTALVSLVSQLVVRGPRSRTWPERGTCCRDSRKRSRNLAYSCSGSEEGR